MEKRDILVIFGPTASGKSKLATQIASKHKSAIINFDSLQVYKDLKILTDRPDDEICKKFDHRLYGMFKGSESCSAAIWLEKAAYEINNCFDNKLLPIVVGGTGLYLKALMDGLSEIPSIKKNIEEQAKLDLKTNGLEHLYKKILTKYPGTKINSKLLSNEPINFIGEFDSNFELIFVVDLTNNASAFKQSSFSRL